MVVGRSRRSYRPENRKATLTAALPAYFSRFFVQTAGLEINPLLFCFTIEVLFFLV
jgi:hypothetical protein